MFQRCCLPLQRVLIRHTANRRADVAVVGVRLCHVGSGCKPPLAAGTLTEQKNAGTTDTLHEQIKGLSYEDQQLILDAVQNPTAQKASVMGGDGIGPKDADMIAAFTCGKCEYRMVKKFSKHAYTKGIVIVECPSCSVRHLLADNLGWFGDEARNIEEILREKGEAFTRIGGGSDIQMEPPHVE